MSSARGARHEPGQAPAQDGGRFPDELVIRNAVLWTHGRREPGADGVAIAGGRVLAMGRSRDLIAKWPRAAVLDAQGATVTPGITDAHIHLLAWARSLDELDIADATSSDDVALRLSARAAAHPGEPCLVGRGWDDQLWEAPPHRSALDRVCPDRPVFLHRHDFHALWLNSAALMRAGVTARTPDPEGGRIERDANGEPTGLLKEHAVRLATACLPPVDEARDRERLLAACASLHALGITAVHVFEGSRSRRLLRELARDERAGLRVLMHLPHAALAAAIALGVRSGAGDLRFRIGGVKLFADGTLGSRTASLLAPYAGTDSVGMDLLSPGRLREEVRRAAAAGLATAVHAIGDRAVRSTLDAFAGVAAARRDLAMPCRIEHVQLLDPADRPRFAALEVAASIQPTHAITDMAAAERWWPDRLEHAYPWAGLLAGGARVAFGSDAPVEPPDPARTLHAAVTRQRVDGSPAGGWDARQRITLDQALSASTEGPARLAGTWPALGGIAPGSEADLVIWDRDLHRSAPERLHEARPAFTLIGGRVVFSAAGRDAGGAMPVRERGAAA